MVPQINRMPRFGRSTINTIKHVVDSEGGLSGGAKSVTNIVTSAAQRPDPFVPGTVAFGSRINAFFLSIFILGATGTTPVGSINWYIIKLHSGQAAPLPGQTGASEVRNQIFHEEKGLSASGDGTPMVFKGVIVVPRGMRRVREGDTFSIQIQSQDTTNDAQFCVKAIYKEIY